MILKTQFRSWDKWISRFIWAGKRPDKSKYPTLQLNKDKGGI